MNPTDQDEMALETPTAASGLAHDDLRILEVHLRVPRKYSPEKFERLVLLTTKIVQQYLTYEVIPDTTVLGRCTHWFSYSRTFVIRFRIQRAHIKNGGRSDELVGLISQAFDNVKIGYEFTRTAVPKSL